MRRPLCLLLAVLTLALCACGKQASEPRAVSLWVAVGDPLVPALAAAAQEYGRTRESGAIPVSLREFEDEEAMRSAFRTARPDLLLCSQALALELETEGLLRSLRAALGPGAPVYPPDIAGRAESIGTAIFPLGARVQLLVTREDAEAEDLSALCARAAGAGRPFLAADSYADLFCQAVLGSGEFHADRRRDCFLPAFCAAWNALAEAALGGGLCTGPEPAAALLRSGLPAAYAYADTLTDLPADAYTLRAAAQEPTPLLVDLRALAVLTQEGRQERGTAAFLSWLFQGERAARLALGRGLIPAQPCSSDGTALSALLLALRERQLWTVGANSDYLKNRAAFEADFRATADLLK